MVLTLLDPKAKVTIWWKSLRSRRALRGDETVFFWATHHRELVDIMDGNKYGFWKMNNIWLYVELYVYI